MEDGHKIVDPLLVLNQAKPDKEERWSFFAVYDGHGGKDEMEYCETRLHQVLLLELSSCRGTARATGSVEGAFTSTFTKIDAELAMLGAWNSGCTATTALIHRHKGGLTLYVANVGDSRAVMVGANSVLRLTVDHKANEPLEQQRVKDEGGIVRHGRVGGQLSVSRSLGDHHLKNAGVSCRPDVRTCGVMDYQALVIASDGLWDALADEEVGKVVADCFRRAAVDGQTQQEAEAFLRENAAQALVDRAKEDGSRDNILALVVFF